VPPVFLFCISDIRSGTESVLKLRQSAAQFPIARALLTDISHISGLVSLVWPGFLTGR
jgi:hypothetical protein